MHYQHFGLSSGHDTFSRETVSPFKEHKKKSQREMLGSCRPSLIYDGSVVFCSLIPMGHVVGSGRNAVLDFVDISEQCVFVRCFSVCISIEDAVPALPNRWFPIGG